MIARFRAWREARAWSLAAREEAEAHYAEQDRLEAAAAGSALLNISSAKVGGIRFLKIGRFCFSFCITREYRQL